LPGGFVAFFHWSLTSVTALGLPVVDDGRFVGVRGDEGLHGEVVDARGRPREALWMRAMASSEKRVSGASGQFEVVGDVVRRCRWRSWGVARSAW